jgi:hypothetical protein
VHLLRDRTLHLLPLPFPVVLCLQEFNALSRELMKGSSSLDSHMMQAPPHDYARIKAGTPVAVVDGLMLHNGSCDG